MTSALLGVLWVVACGLAGLKASDREWWILTAACFLNLAGGLLIGKGLLP